MHTVVVAAAVLVEVGRVLLTQRKAGKHLAGAWEFPGGKVLPGEDPRAGLEREIREELGMEVQAGEIIDVTFHRYDDPPAAPMAVLLLFFEVARVPGSPEPRALDVAAFAWAGPEDLDPARFPPADVGVLTKVRRRLSAEVKAPR